MDDDVEITDVDDDLPYEVKKTSLRNQDLSSMSIIGNVAWYQDQLM